MAHSGHWLLVVAERGADPARVRELARDRWETVVIEQGAREPIADFAVRVRGAAGANGGSAHPATRVVLVGGGRADSDTVSARGLVIRSVASAMARAEGGEIVLESDGSPDRFTMAALATTAAEQLRGAGVDVRHRDVAARPRRLAADRRAA